MGGRTTEKTGIISNYTKKRADQNGINLIYQREFCSQAGSPNSQISPKSIVCLNTPFQSARQEAAHSAGHCVKGGMPPLLHTHTHI